MRKSIIFIVWLLLFFNQVYCYQVIVGDGNEASQHLPCDPFYNHSGSQLIFDSNYFPYCGIITNISFQYQFMSSNPQNFISNITLMIGESQTCYFQDDVDFIDLELLELSFSGELTAQNFQASDNNGAGWLNITLDQPYNYSKTGNLIIFFLENDSDNGINGDNFIASATPQNTSMCFIDLDNPIDIDDLVEPMFIRSWLPNTIFEMTIDENYPQAISPFNNAEDVEVTSPFHFNILDTVNAEITLTSANNLVSIPVPEDLQSIGEHIYQLFPELPFAPNSYYEWQVSYTNDEVIYLSEIFSFNTSTAEDELDLITSGTDSYAVNLTWSSLYDNQFPYIIYRDGEVLSIQHENTLVDFQVITGETYDYQVKFFYIDNSLVESNICLVELEAIQNDIINEQFESYPSFQENFGEWQNIDNDGSSTYSLPGHEYPNQGAETGFIIFEPGAISPPLDLIISGEKCLVSFASSVPPTSDLMISPSFQSSQVEIDVFLQSYDISWGMERVKCGVIYNNDPGNTFTFQNGDYLEIPGEMTHLNFVHAAPSENETITNFWLESCSIQTLMLIIDRVVISAPLTGNADSEVEIASDLMIFPNPITKGSFEIVNQRADSDIRIYNLKGQLVYKTKTDSRKPTISLPQNIASGIYLVKMKSGDGETVKKISVLK